MRPHMQQPTPREGRGLAGEAAAATSDLGGEIISAPVHRALEGDIPRDDLCLLKGVGPKFADALHAAGFGQFRPDRGLVAGRDRAARPAARRVQRPNHPRPDRRAGGLSRAQRHRRLRAEVRQAQPAAAVSLSAGRFLGREAISLSILRPSMSTISNDQPSWRKVSPVSGRCLRTDSAKPATVE